MKLDLDALHLVLPGGHRALAGVSLAVARGERVAVIGPSGAGKTSLLRLLGLALRPSAGALAIADVDPWALPARALQQLRGRIGMVHQAPPLPPRQRLVTAVLAGRLGAWGLWRGLASLAYPADIAGARATLARLDLAERVFDRCDRLSGGQLQRVGVARVLYQKPDLILADEPVSALDPQLADQTVGELHREAQSRGVTLVASLHAVDLALKWFPRIVGLRDGAVAFDCPPLRVSDAMLHELYATESQTLPVQGSVPLAHPEPLSRTARRGAQPPVPIAAAAAAPRDPALPARVALTVVLLLLLWPALELTEFDPGKLREPGNLQIMGRFLGTFFPLALGADFLGLVLRSALETLALATAGMALAVAIAVPLSLAVAESLSVSRIGPARLAWLRRALRGPVRLLLVVMRSIPEIVWALLFVRAVGLGPAAGILAIAINYAGMLGKVYFEIYEAGDTRPARAVLEAGGGRLHAFFYGILPVSLPELVSYTVYRWECAIRASVVMGFVGAGGLGQQMELSMRMLAGGEVATMLLAFFALVMLADGISALLRKVLT